MRRVTMCVIALALVLALAGCQMQSVRTMDNGASGDEEWKIPVPVWPFGPCDKEPATPEKE